MAGQEVSRDGDKVSRDSQTSPAASPGSALTRLLVVLRVLGEDGLDDLVVLFSEVEGHVLRVVRVVRPVLR